MAEQVEWGLGDAMAVAAEAHRRQKDKAGEPYILHVMRVVSASPDGDTKIVAALHDVVEDTHLDIHDIRQMPFPPDVCEAVEVLTRRPGQSYRDYIDRVALNPLAREVKMADLRDNMIRERLPNPTERDLKRWVKYDYALDRLNFGNWLDNVPPELAVASPEGGHGG